MLCEYREKEPQTLSDMQVTEDNLYLRTLLEPWGWNRTSVLDKTQTSFQSEAEAPSPR